MSEAVDVLIIGAGFSGLGMAIQLRKAGIDSFLDSRKRRGDRRDLVVQQVSGLRLRHPVASLLRSRSIAIPSGAACMRSRPKSCDYLRASAKRHGVAQKVRLRTPLREARWDEEAGVWHVIAGDGQQIDARVLVSGMGALHVPRYPDLNGVERFAGPSFHSRELGRRREPRRQERRGHRDRRKLMPIRAADCAPSRPALRISTHANLDAAPTRPPDSRKWRRFFRTVPGATWLVRTLLFWRLEAYVFGFLGNRWMRRMGEKQARKHLEKQVADPNLRALLTPKYEFGCKRVVISSDFYPTLARPNVELVTAGIAEVREHSIVTDDGRERPIDVMIYGTGFRATELLRGIRIVGRGGLEIQTRGAIGSARFSESPSAGFRTSSCCWVRTPAWDIIPWCS